MNLLRQSEVSLLVILPKIEERMFADFQLVCKLAQYVLLQ